MAFLGVQIRGLEELGRDLQRAVDLATVGIRQEAASVLREGRDVVRAYTPVRTGKTRRGIHTRVNPQGAHGVRGGIRAAFDARAYIGAVERRHGMFRRGYAHVDRVAVDRLQDAVDAAVNQVFRRGG